MIGTSIITYLVHSTFNTNAVNLNRLTCIILSFSAYILYTAVNIPSLNDITIYNSWFTLTPYVLPITTIILLLTIILITYLSSNHKLELTPYLSIILMVTTLSLILLPMSNDLLAFYTVLELQSFGLYLLTGMHNKSLNTTRAAMLYLIIGGVASAIILMGIYYIYEYTGSTNMSAIAQYYSYNPNYLYSNIIIFGLMIKMGMAPVHQWSIAVYNYAPTYITAYISIVAKLSIITWISCNIWLFDNNLLLWVFYISLLIGAYKPLFEVNIKVILAYSGILNFAYILLGLISGDISVYIYLIQYSLNHILMFMIILAAGHTMKHPNTEWSPLLFIHDLIINNKVLVFIFILTLLSLIGIPPLPGFYGKYYILISSIQDNYILQAVLLVIFSVIATYYYANIIRALITNYNSTSAPVLVNPTLAYIISTLAVLTISWFAYMPNIFEGLYILIL